MSEFLTNLAARTLGSLETARPRVPSRFEPVRGADGILAGRTPAKEESAEDDSSMETVESEKAVTAAEQVGKFPRATQPADFPSRLPSPTLASAESLSEAIPALIHGSTEQAARSWMAPPAVMAAPTPKEPVLGGKAIPAFETATQAMRAVPARQTVADTVTPGLRDSESVSRHEPTDTWMLHAAQPGIGKRREANEGATVWQAGHETRSVQGPQPGRRNQEPVRASSAASPGPEIEPLETALAAFENSRSDGPEKVQFQPPRVMQISSKRSYMGEVLRDVSGGDAGSEFPSALEQARSAGRLTLKPDLTPDLAIGPAPGQEAETPVIGAGPAGTAARQAAPTLTPQALAGAEREPAIRVTIGRVEVRAVFPEQPAKRSAPGRFRPSVTLDEYLKRGNGATR